MSQKKTNIIIVVEKLAFLKTNKKEQDSQSFMFGAQLFWC